MNLFKEMGLPIAAADAASGALPFAGGSFGLVLFNETLEHLAGSPLPAMKEMARVLAPGGMLLITTPNAASLRNRINLLLGRNIYTPLRVAVNVAPYKCHNREYTLGEVVELIGMAGLEPVRASRHNVGRPVNGTLKKIAHAAYYAATWAWPPGRSLVCVVARKP
jgi:SAM-dependent methyltransferase